MDYPEDFTKDKKHGKLSHRAFPKSKLVLLIILIALQVGAIVLAVFYVPSPQDRIDSYTVTINPCADGTLDITYDFVWTPLDKTEPLTWIKIGIPNGQATIDRDSLSDEISYANVVDDYGYSYVELYLVYTKYAGKTFQFSFTVHQAGMLCKDSNGYFYEFIPGWFNETPVESFCLRWKADNATQEGNTILQDGYYTYQGTLDVGTYYAVKMHYPLDAFSDEATVSTYYPFDSSGVYDELADDRSGFIVFMVLICIVLAFAELSAIDSFVSYHRGRGFMRGYGHYIHINGHSNPYYRAEAAKRAAASRASGGHSGGHGCACACACACAGGGRAGCSRKDTYTNRKSVEDSHDELCFIDGKIAKLTAHCVFRRCRCLYRKRSQGLPQ